MKTISLIAAGALLFTLSAYGNEDGVKWNAQYNEGNNSVQIVVDTQGLDKASHLEGVRFRFVTDAGGKIQLALRQKEVKAGTVVHEVISVGGRMHSLTPDALFYRVGVDGAKVDTSPAGQAAAKPHQLAPTADLHVK